MSEKTTASADKKTEIKSKSSVSPPQKSDSSQFFGSPVDRILFLQRTIGNQAVGRLIRSGALQTKLRISEPGDIYEQEADRVAEQVMCMPEPQAVSRDIPRIRRACPTCEEKELQRQSKEKEEEEKELLQTKPTTEQIIPLIQRQAEEEEEELQTKESSDHISELTPNLESHIQSLRGGGEPLPESVRAFFEPRFGYDFSNVRVHTDAKAAEAARAVNARAFTVGKHVFFNAEQYAPERKNGRQLLAHELTHVVQQGRERDYIQRYEETTEPSSRLSEAAKSVSPPILIYRIIKARKCLSGLFRPMHDITFERWILHACRRSPTGFLHSREWDAFGHCWISCEGSRRCGAIPTAILGAAYEIDRELGKKKKPHDSFKQDLNNQAAGGSLAFKSGTCFALCDGAHHEGKLDLSAPQRVCADCSTYPASYSDGPCPPSRSRSEPGLTSW